MLPPRAALVALALCALPLAALTGCSSPSSASPATASSGSSTAPSTSATAVSHVARPTDLCALLSTAEATAAVKTTIATTYKGESSCGYTGEDLHFSVNLAPTEIDSLSTEAGLLKLDVGDVKPLSGVGDEAVGNADGVAFRVGTVIMWIETDPGTTRTTEDELAAVARTVIGHLR